MSYERQYTQGCHFGLCVFNSFCDTKWGFWLRKRAHLTSDLFRNEEQTSFPGYHEQFNKLPTFWRKGDVYTLVHSTIYKVHVQQICYNDIGYFDERKMICLTPLIHLHSAIATLLGKSRAYRYNETRVYCTMLNNLTAYFNHLYHVLIMLVMTTLRKASTQTRRFSINSRQKIISLPFLELAASIDKIYLTFIYEISWLL